MEPRFAGLRLVAGMLKVLAWLVLVVGAILSLLAFAGGVAGGALGAPGMGMPPRAGILGGILGLILTAIYFAFLYGAAELIYLLLAIEAHTRELARRLGAREES